MKKFTCSCGKTLVNPLAIARHKLDFPDRCRPVRKPRLGDLEQEIVRCAIRARRKDDWQTVAQLHAAVDKYLEGLDVTKA